MVSGREKREYSFFFSHFLINFDEIEIMRYFKDEEKSGRYTYEEN